MKAGDLARLAAGSLGGHGLRTVLCLIGVAVGVSSVILLTALGEGARLYVTGEFATLGSDLIIVIRGRTETAGAAPFGGTPYDLTIADAEAVAREIPSVRMASPLSMGTASISWQGKNRDVPVVGTTAEFLPLRGVALDVGRFLPEGEWTRGERVVVLGRVVQRELFGEVNPLGQTLRIDDWRFRVIGVLSPRGESLGMDMDDMVMVPVATGMRIFDRTSLFRILIKARQHGEIDVARDAVVDLLKTRHDGQEDVTVITQDAVLESFNRILGVLTLAIGGIGAISLAVAGIGVMNVMLVSVTERTSEVGLLRAVGVLRRQVMLLFLAEAAALALIGGILGLGLGYLLVAAARALYPALPATPPDWAVGAVLLLSLAVGLLSGVIPARRAAGLDPVSALASRRGA
jgi:putative ABC transport system permease protein